MALLRVPSMTVSHYNSYFITSMLNGCMCQITGAYRIPDAGSVVKVNISGT